MVKRKKSPHRETRTKSGKTNIRTIFEHDRENAGIPDQDEEGNAG
jgi:hypothetical protein